MSQQLLTLLKKNLCDTITNRWHLEISELMRQKPTRTNIYRIVYSVLDWKSCLPKRAAPLTWRKWAAHIERRRNFCKYTYSVLWISSPHTYGYPLEQLNYMFVMTWKTISPRAEPILLCCLNYLVQQRFVKSMKITFYPTLQRGGGVSCESHLGLLKEAIFQAYSVPTWWKHSNIWACATPVFLSTLVY